MRGLRHLYLSMQDRSKPAAEEAGSSTPITYSVAAAGTTAAPGCTTLFFASSSRYSQLSPSRPVGLIVYVDSQYLALTWVHTF